MKKLFDILTDENKDFDYFPWWVYAFVIPAGLALLMAVAGWIDTLCV